jgi:hypothetical protein
MRRYVKFSIVLSAALLLAAVLPAGATSKHPFRGNWKGLDWFDGSNITYQIVEEARTGGHVFEIRGTDDRTGGWCGGGPATLKAIGVLEADNYLVLSLVWNCLADNTILYFLSDTFTYDPATGTITDSGGGVFHRER